MDGRKQWAMAKAEMMLAMARLGFPEALGEELAKNLKSPKAMERMTSYLVNVRPTKPELVVDEMLAICSDIEAWREKKESEAANAFYNDLLNNGFDH
jgi:hypothetical protein